MVAQQILVLLVTVQICLRQQLYKNLRIMYSTKLAQKENLKGLLDLLDDYTIYSYYIGNFQVNKLYNSPLRSDDKNPSFAIFKGKNGDLLFKDHGNGESGNALKFIKLINRLNTKDQLESELLKIIKRTNPNNIPVKRNFEIKSHDTEIQIARQPFTDIDKQYWSQYGITINTLKKFNVFSIKYFLCNGTLRARYSKSSPMYAYKVFNHFKIYRPYETKLKKWRTNLKINDIQGLAELPPKGGHILIITKSLKDVMVLYEMGYFAISASSETVFIPEDLLEDLKHKWSHIYILYDRDATGMLKAREYSKKYKIDAFFINKKFKSKDISDCVKNNGMDNTRLWLENTINKYETKKYIEAVNRKS